MDVEARPRGKRINFTRDQKTRIALFYLQGKTFGEVARKFGCSKTTARAVVMSQGVSPRPHGQGSVMTCQDCGSHNIVAEEV